MRTKTRTTRRIENISHIQNYPENMFESFLEEIYKNILTSVKAQETTTLTETIG